jgi:hypothetical protein
MSIQRNRPHSGKRGFRRLSFDEAYPHAERAIEIRERLTGPLSPEDRDSLQAELRAVDNKLTPAFRQSSGPFRSMVRKAAKVWIEQRGGMPNISDFIREFQSREDAVRHRSCGPVPASDDAIRKILREMGVRGRSGRPPGATN